MADQAMTRLQEEYGADYFNCGMGLDKVTDYNPAEGDSFVACEVVT